MTPMQYNIFSIQPLAFQEKIDHLCLIICPIIIFWMAIICPTIVEPIYKLSSKFSDLNKSLLKIIGIL